MIEKEIFKGSTRTIIGIGINLNIKKEESWWGDLSKYELETKRNRLINLIIFEIIKLEHNYDWINEWRSGCMHLNREVEIYKDEEFVKKVIFKDIDENGNGILQSKNGNEKISSGQINIKGIY